MEANKGRIIAMGNVPHYNPNVYWEGEIIDCSLSYYSVLHKKCNPDIEEEKEEEILTEDQLIYPDGYLQQLERIKEEEKRLEDEKRRLEELLNEGKEEEYTQEELKRLNQYPEKVRDVFRRESLPYADVYRNSASSSMYEPGSVVKVLTLAAAYNFDAIPTDPEYQLGSHQGCEQVIDVRLCTSNRRPRASLNVEEMLRDSDNIGAFRVAQKIPAKDFAETLQRFGLGQKSNIELADEPFFSMKPPAQWTKVDLSTGAFGQGSVAFTPVQLTAAWNALASNGYYYRPTIIDSREDNGQIMKFATKPIRQAVKPEAAQKALEVNGIATRNSSTRARQFYDKYTFSGKTATANIPKPDGIGYLPNAVNMGYIGVAPLDNPKFTMLVWFNEPKLGENGVNPDSISVAQYAWLDIANDLMIKLNIPPKRL
jgi:cell division protein FtsI/penicillin-binding protein 2